MSIHVLLTCPSDSFAEPNPNDSIPNAASNIGPDGTPHLHSDGSGPSVPTATISIPVPNGDALDTPEPNANAGGILAGPNAAGEGIDEGEGNLDANGRPIPIEELFVKDAFLVFRALCKLSMKPLVTER